MAQAKQPVVPYDAQTSSDDAVAAHREERDVHAVYEAIAPHFSSTRYKPWPLIAAYLSRIPPGSFGLDAGAGNGKYLPVLAASSAGSRMIALDRSTGLLEIAQKQAEADEECVRGDLCFHGWREGVFDFIISIAAIHHLSTHPRRVESVRSILRPLVYARTSPFASFIVYVWAFEQGEGSKRKMGSAAHEAERKEAVDGVTEDQDVLVPWVLQAQLGPSAGQAKQRKGRKGRGSATDQEAAPAATPGPEAPPTPPPQVYRRYYHLFKEGELQDLVREAARAEGLRVLEADEEGVSDRWMRIRGVGYERDNWWLEGEVGMG